MPLNKCAYARETGSSVWCPSQLQTTCPSHRAACRHAVDVDDHRAVNLPELVRIKLRRQFRVAYESAIRFPSRASRSNTLTYLSCA